MLAAGIIDDIRAGLVRSAKAVQEPIDEWILGLPDWTPQACAVGLFVAAGIWVFTLKRDFVYLGAPDRAIWRDLRIWAWVTLAPYIALYLLLGT